MVKSDPMLGVYSERTSAHVLDMRVLQSSARGTLSKVARNRSWSPPERGMCIRGDAISASSSSTRRGKCTRMRDELMGRDHVSSFTRPLCITCHAHDKLKKIKDPFGLLSSIDRVGAP